MAYQLSKINDAVRTDPKAFLEESDEKFNQKVRNAADQIIGNMKNSPIVLLAGPSGSGKTTSSLKIREELLRRGIGTHTISMDDYFLPVSPLTTPRTRTGEYDFESPLCMDLELLHEHFNTLNQGGEVLIPKYDFIRHMRDTSRVQPLKLGKDEVVIYEGIHALNDALGGRHPEAFGIYLSARSNVLEEGETVFKGTWMRLSRRCVRDLNFRGTEATVTLSMWPNIRRGEKLYISPFKDRAHLKFDSALPYEVCVLANYAAPLFRALPEDSVRKKEYLQMIEAYDRFERIDPELVAKDSLIREFIGGGTYGAH